VYRILLFLISQPLEKACGSSLLLVGIVRNIVRRLSLVQVKGFRE